MRFIDIPIMWMTQEMAELNDLGIEFSYDGFATKVVGLNIGNIDYFFEDEDPRYTCIVMDSGNELVTNIPFLEFKRKLQFAA